MAHEVVEQHVLDGAAATVGLEHVHLVCVVSVDIVVLNVVDICYSISLGIVQHNFHAMSPFKLALLTDARCQRTHG